LNHARLVFVSGIIVGAKMEYYSEERAKIVVKDSTRCEHCDRLMKVYKYKILNSMVYALAIIYRHAKKTGEEWIHLNKFFDDYPLPSVRHWEYLQYWDLIIASPEEASDGNPSGIGFYKITLKAEEFLKGNIKIPKFCLHYRRKVIGMSEVTIDVNEAYKKPFDFEKFMEGD
jgi:hypothetical protein